MFFASSRNAATGVAATSFNRVKAAKFRQQTNDHMTTLRLSGLIVVEVCWAAASTN